MWDLKIKQQAHRYRDRLAVARGRSFWALGEMGEGTQKVHNFSYKMKQVMGCNIHHDSFNYNIIKY